MQKMSKVLEGAPAPSRTRWFMRLYRTDQAYMAQ